MTGMDDSWPVVGFETHPWHPEDLSGFSHRARRLTRGPYQAAVVPRIAERAVVLPSAVLADAAEAQAAISRFDERVSHALGARAVESETAEVAELGPMAAILLRTESASSSQIENLTVGARQLALAEMEADLAHRQGRRRSERGNADLVVRNVAAVRAALRAAEDLSLDTVLGMHRTLLEGSEPEQAGRFREQPVWIGGSNAGPQLATFVPPHHSRVRASMADLMVFCDRDDLPAYVQAALAHAQFETIHPFTDGNGRTGRALVHALLRGKGVTTRVTVPVSAGLLSETESYFAALGDYRAGNPVPIVERFNSAAFASIANGQRLLDDVEAIVSGWRSVLRARSDAAVWRLADRLVAQPVVTSESVRLMLGVSQPVADAAIGLMAEAGFLTQVNPAARRYRIWQAPEILAALEDFAARARRRYPTG